MDDARLTAAASQLAASLLESASADTTRRERARARRLGRLLADPAGRELLFALTDEVLRTDDHTRAVRRLRTLVHGSLPRALGRVDRAGMRMIASTYIPRLGGRTDALIARAIRTRIEADTRHVILSANDPAFARHLARRRHEGIDTNVNLLGEAILGDEEANARVDAVSGRLRRDDVQCVSVKISSLCANLDVLAFDASVERIAERLRKLARVALERSPAPMLYLDMEEYRDLHLTVAAFREVFAESSFRSLPVGIALQAYLPDSYAVLDDLCNWSHERRADGGEPVRVRIVKGANLAMEQVEAELMGWEQAPYGDKADVDANFKRMLDRAIDAAAADDVRVGVASHNLFDVAWALTLRDARGVGDHVEIEMLEGMAPPQARAVRARAGSLLLYTPVVDEADFAPAIAYLSRRLDENAAEDNFLRSLFSISAGSAVWERERSKFQAAVARRHDVSTAPRRTQDRRTERRCFDADAPFENEPDTDFTLASNRSWVAEHLRRDPSPPLPAEITHTDEIDAVLERARAAAQAWASTSSAERRVLLTRVAEVMAAERGTTVAVMAYDVAKPVREADAEVSEGIDMARWAATQTRVLEALARDDGVLPEPRGVVLVTAPWNFPYAIPANGVLSALAAGNAVVLKPAPEAVATAAALVAQIHRAGMPPDVVQLVRCPDGDTGRHLVTHDAVDTVVLTGAYDTAQMFLDWKPQLRLIAETSGKNALVVTGAADIDLAIHDIVRSAFGFSGQKCSAASLAIVEASVYDDGRFLERLADATRSVRVGAATNLSTMMGAVIAPAQGKLLRGLTELDRGEAWLLEPKAIDGARRVWTPGIRTGVRAGSWFHGTECFGPVLGVMRARDLDDALALQNATEFGLTAGLHSLDPDEITHWCERVEAGNAYVNRHTTGAIVRRQPFGGWKHSSVGPGAKTGGPHDILRFVRLHATTLDRALDARAIDATDSAGLRSEQNLLRYRPIGRVIVRPSAATTADELAVTTRAARVARADIEIADRSETDEALARRIAATGAQRLRALGPISDALARACHVANIAIDDTSVTASARVELTRYVREQAISRTMHRHGRIGTSLD